MTRKELEKQLKELARKLSNVLHDEAWETIFHDNVDEVDEYVLYHKTKLLDEVFFDEPYSIKECVRGYYE